MFGVSVGMMESDGLPGCSSSVSITICLFVSINADFIYITFNRERERERCRLREIVYAHSEMIITLTCRSARIWSSNGWELVCYGRFKNAHYVSQMLNVWYIYLHLPPKLPKCR